MDIQRSFLTESRVAGSLIWCAAILLTHPAALCGQESAHCRSNTKRLRFALQAAAGFTGPGGLDEVDIGGMYGMKVRGVHSSGRWSLDAAWVRAAYNPATDEFSDYFTANRLTVAGLVYLTKGRLQPYVSVGSGMYWMGSVQRGFARLDERTWSALNGAFGVEKRITNRASVVFELAQIHYALTGTLSRHLTHWNYAIIGFNVMLN